MIDRSDRPGADPTELTADDTGKRVVDEAGRPVGVVSAVEGGTAYVDPDPAVAETLLARLGWAQIEADDYPLNRSLVAEVTEDEIRLDGRP
jgi:hypothetical protein